MKREKEDEKKNMISKEFFTTKIDALIKREDVKSREGEEMAEREREK